MNLSLTPILLTAELAFLYFTFRRVNDGKPFPPPLLMTFWLWIASYAGLVTYLGYQGFFVSEDLFRFYPAFSSQMIAVIACVTPVIFSARLRDELRRAIDFSNRQSFIYFQMLRLSAVGTLAGTYKGEFPLYFELFVGVPDLLFAVSSVWVLSKARADRLSDRQFLWWNVIGALVIVPAAPILLQLGFPGPLQVFTAQPDARAVFAFPMSVAPTIGVPLFVLVNLTLVWRLLEQRARSRRQAATKANLSVYGPIHSCDR